MVRSGLQPKGENHISRGDAEKTTVYPHMLAKISRNCTLIVQKKGMGMQEKAEANRDLAFSFVSSFNCFVRVLSITCL